MISLTQNYLSRGFWGDEAWTSLISQLPYLQMLKTTAADFHPPGYYTVIELVYKVIPANELATRMVSIFFWFATVWMVFLLGRKFKGVNFGLISALVVAVNPIFFTYAFEARNYTMFAFAATASFYFLLRLLDQKVIASDQRSNLKTRLPRGLWPLAMTRDYGFYILFSVLGIYTHYYMFFVLASQGLYVLLFERKIFLRLLLPWIAILLLYAPWIPFLFGQLTSVGEGYWIGNINARTHYEALLRILSGEDTTVFQPFLFWSSIALIVFGIWHHLTRRTFEKPYILIWFWAVVPFILASLPGFKVNDSFTFPFRPIFFWRYLIGASVPLALLIVHGAQRLSSLYFKLSMGIIVVLSVGVNLITWSKFPPTFKQVYETQVIGSIGSSDKIVTVLASFAEVLYYRNYFGLKNDIIVLPEGLVQSSGKSLLDTYSENGVVSVGNAPEGENYFKLMRDDNYVPQGRLVTIDN